MYIYIYGSKSSSNSLVRCRAALSVWFVLLPADSSPGVPSGRSQTGRPSRLSAGQVTCADRVILQQDEPITIKGFLRSVG